MKKTLFLLLLIFFTFSTTFSASAELGNQGLIINEGAKEIRIEVGEKMRLWVRDGLTGLPLTQGVHFYSDNDLIATIGEDSGILHGISAGSAHITIMSSSGRSARIKVVAESRNKASPLLLLLFAPLILLLAFKRNALKHR